MRPGSPAITYQSALGKFRNRSADIYRVKVLVHLDQGLRDPHFDWIDWAATLHAVPKRTARHSVSSMAISPVPYPSSSCLQPGPSNTIVVIVDMGFEMPALVDPFIEKLATACQLSRFVLGKIIPGRIGTIKVYPALTRWVEDTTELQEDKDGGKAPRYC